MTAETAPPQLAAAEELPRAGIRAPDETPPVEQVHDASDPMGDRRVRAMGPSPRSMTKSPWRTDPAAPRVAGAGFSNHSSNAHIRHHQVCGARISYIARHLA